MSLPEGSTESKKDGEMLPQLPKDTTPYHVTTADIETVLVLIDTVCASGLKRNDLRLLADLNDKFSNILKSVTKTPEKR